MIEKYYHKRLQSGHPGDDGEHCWMEVKSNWLVYVTATVVLCCGRGLAEDINGQIGLVVHADVNKRSYRVRFEDTALGERTVNAESAIMLFADDE